MTAVLAFAPDLSALKAADDGDAPGVRADGRLDINNVYAVQSTNLPDAVIDIHLERRDHERLRRERRRVADDVPCRGRTESMTPVFGYR